MNLNQKKMPHTRMSFAVTEDMKQQLDKTSAKQHIPTGELVRRYVENGLQITKTKGDIDFIRKNIREELHSVMDGYMNRIIKLNVKIGVMTVSMCYFTSKLTYILISRYKNNLNYDEMMTESKRNAAAFLGMKDSSIDELCSTILKDKTNRSSDEDYNFFEE